MTLSFIGLAVWLLLLLAGRLTGGAIIIGFFASLPFGSTAFATLNSLGGSSPQIYTLFVVAILGATVARRDFNRDLGSVFARYKTAGILSALAFYALAGAYLFPRLFEGETTTFVPFGGVVKEVPLAAVSGNITQPAYFLLGAFMFIAFCVLLLRAENVRTVQRGFFAFVIVHALLGWLDLGGKLTGSRDVLAPIRTATYALLTDVEQSGFWRIVGGCSEASSFAALALAGLAFAFTYWREAGSWLALTLTVLMLVLVLLSTSSTAYVGCAVLAILALGTLAKAGFQNRLKAQDLSLAIALLSVLAAILAIYLYDSGLFAPFTDLLRTMVFEKATSASGQERAYWNAQSLQSFLDTAGMGVGMGSSRSSSWPVSTLSQLGLVGSIMMLSLVTRLAWGMGRLRPLPGEEPLFALCASVRACGLAFLLANSIAGGTADPGVLFFASLATVLACQRHVLVRRRSSTVLKAPPVAGATLLARRRA